MTPEQQADCIIDASKEINEGFQCTYCGANHWSPDCPEKHPALMGSLVYLASPYSHPSESVRELRFRKISEIAAVLMSRGMHIYAPISHTHPIAVYGKLETGWDFWEQYDRRILAVCGVLLVAQMGGWMESKGVAAEIEIATEFKLKVMYYSPSQGRISHEVFEGEGI